MARSIIRKPHAMDTAHAVSHVPPHPRLARQSFVKLSAATATLTGLAMTGRMVGRAGAETRKPSTNPGSQTVRTVCISRAVGCGIDAEVHCGIWARQEISAVHPVSFSGHCCKGDCAVDMITSEKGMKDAMEIYPVPSACQYETSGSATSSCQVQLPAKVVGPICDCPAAGIAGLRSWSHLAPRRYAAAVLLVGTLYITVLGFAVSALAGQILPGQADAAVPRLAFVRE